MTYVVTNSCVGMTCKACIDACPVDCFYFIPTASFLRGVGFVLAGADDDRSATTGMVMIHPDECINCGACETECPVEAIYEETVVPKEIEEFIDLNARITRRMSVEDRNVHRCRKDV